MELLFIICSYTDLTLGDPNMAIRLSYIIVYEILILFQMTDNKTKMIGYEAARSCAPPKKPDFLNKIPC